MGERFSSTFGTKEEAEVFVGNFAVEREIFQSALGRYVKDGVPRNEGMRLAAAEVGSLSERTAEEWLSLNGLYIRTKGMLMRVNGNGNGNGGGLVSAKVKPKRSGPPSMIEKAQVFNSEADAVCEALESELKVLLRRGQPDLGGRVELTWSSVERAKTAEKYARALAAKAWGGPAEVERRGRLLKIKRMKKV